MTSVPPDRSRDRRIEDPTNLLLVHPLSRLLLRPALAAGVSANAVSVMGLCVGAGAALAFYHWREPGLVVVGLVLAVAWLVADGLDGMVARATGSASPLGRVLDGVCDHGVFALIYIALAASIGTAEAWALAVAAAVAHGVQSALYEGERARYHRRINGLPPSKAQAPSRNPMVRAYDALSFALDRAGAGLDARFAGSDAERLAFLYREAAAGPMRLQALLTANARVLLIVLACLFGDPRLFWWAELGPLTIVAVLGLGWHRRVEARLSRRALSSPRMPGPAVSKDRSR